MNPNSAPTGSNESFPGAIPPQEDLMELDFTVPAGPEVRAEEAPQREKDETGISAARAVAEDAYDWDSPNQPKTLN